MRELIASRRGAVTLSLFLVAAGVGAADVVYALHTWWLGSDFQLVVRTVNAFFHNRPVDTGYIYPPGLLLLAWPLSFSFVQAGRRAEDLMLVLDILGTAYSIVVAARLLRVRLFSPEVATLALALVLGGQIIFVLRLENLTIALLPFELTFYWLALRAHWVCAGVMLGVSLTIKPMLLPLVLLLLIDRRWRAAVVALVTPAAITGLAALVSSQFSRVWHNFRAALTGGAGTHTGINLKSIGLLWHVNSTLVTLVGVVLGIAVLVVVVRVWVGVEDDEQRFLWTGQVLLAGFLTLFGFSHSFYGLLLIPVWLLGVAAQRPPTRWLACLAVLLLLLPLQLVDVGSVVTGRAQLTLGCVGMLLVVVAAFTVPVRAGLSARRVRRLAATN